MAMKKLYSQENRLQVFHVKNLLELENIPLQLKNEFVGGAVGDLSPFDTWLEIWVNEQDFERAQQVLEAAKTKPLGENIICPHCGAVNEPQFKICWNCQASLSLY